MFTVDLMTRVAVYEQIVKQVEEMILTGILKEGDKLPSVRSLSMKLSINPNTIQKAYTELDRKEWIVTVPGKGSFISKKALQLIEEDFRQNLTKLREMVMKLSLAGVTRQEVLDVIDDIYR